MVWLIRLHIQISVDSILLIVESGMLHDSTTLTYVVVTVVEGHGEISDSDTDWAENASQYNTWNIRPCCRKFVKRGISSR